ncbi:SDA1-domain-containing protein [Meira miltonrushii]|uniref:Protein SDA1 n=1 Tax=Meira miltonrushii TaxID=1280837 RepID=A0A316VQK3_9BASI|nr:SDA1-domain-containing protein [Meira miltonrushii]PWN38441.1 SDA1-domain-containing protein [Meira miltonrushii]
MAPSIEPVSAIVTENGLRHRSKARGLLNASNLPALQNLIKRDPGSYVDDFRSQWNHYESLRQLYTGSVAMDSMDIGMASNTRVLNKDQEDKFVALLSFVTQLAPSFPEMTSPLFQQLSSLLLEHHAIIGKEVRSACVRSLVLMRNRDVISSEQLLKTLFPLLLASPSSSLRSLLQRTITTDLKNANAKSRNHSLNRVVQGLLFGVVEVGMPGHGSDPTLARSGYGKKDAGSKSGGEALWAVRLAADLWSKRIWNDEKTVSLLALACLHPHPRVQSSAVRFFLGDLNSSEAGDNSDSENDSDNEGEIPNVSSLVHKRKVNKKTRSNDKKVRAAATLAKRRKKALEDKRIEKEGQEGDSNVAAVHLLNDPQGFGEKLFEELKRGDKRLLLEHKVRIMQLLARVMSSHKACVLGFYSYAVKYMMPHQTHITLILVSVAQSVHTQTPPSVLLPLIRKLAHNFVHPGVGPEVVAAGINTIREICARQIWALGSEDTRVDDGRDLLEDLISYRKSKDKGVAAASRGILMLYRKENPKLLPRKERGKDGSMKADKDEYTVRGFGENGEVTHGIAGLDLLAKHLEEADSEAEEERDRQAWDGWDQDSDDSDASSGGWINVSSEGEDFDVSDSEDEEGKKAKSTTNGDEAQKSQLERVRERRMAKRESRRKARLGEEEPKEDSDAEKKEEKVEVKVDESTNNEAAKAIEELATTRILTPADFALLNKLRLEAAQSALSSAKSGNNASLSSIDAIANGTISKGGVVNELDILGVGKKRKMDYEERMASIEKGREGREAFGSKKGKRNKATPSSSSNADKKKSKPYMMVAHSLSVKDKKNAKLSEKSRRLKLAKDKQRKQYK